MTSLTHLMEYRTIGMTNLNLLGTAAGTLCTISFIPQAIKLWKTRQAHDISLITFSIFCCGIVLWIAYGFLTENYPIIVANAATLVLALMIIIMKIRFK